MSPSTVALIKATALLRESSSSFHRLALGNLPPKAATQSRLAVLPLAGSMATLWETAVVTFRDALNLARVVSKIAASSSRVIHPEWRAGVDVCFLGDSHRERRLAFFLPHRWRFLPSLRRAPSERAGQHPIGLVENAQCQRRVGQPDRALLALTNAGSHHASDEVGFSGETDRTLCLRPGDPPPPRSLSFFLPKQV